MPPASESSFSAILTLGFGGKSFPPDGRKQPTISENKSLVPLHVLAELHVWTAYHPLDGGELAWRATGLGESWHLQTRSP